MNMGEVLAAKRKEIEEKYAELIKDICVRFDKTTDVGFDILIAIARANKENLEPEYDIKDMFDEEAYKVFTEQLAQDYEEFLKLAEDKANAEGLVGIE